MKLWPTSLLGGFFLATVLWLPVLFACWYLLADFLSWPAVQLSQWLLTGLFPEVFAQAEGAGQHLIFVTRLEVEGGALSVGVNPLIYSWNLPVVAALVFAADERHFSSWRLLLAFVVLSLLHVWGICFDAVRTLAFNAGPDARDALALSDWQREAVALGYQFGYLMLPAIGAASLWVVMSRQFIEQVLLRRAFQPSV